MEYKINDIENILKKLFSDNGCSWDKSQTFKTLRKSILEETYELIEAIDKDSVEDILEEVGDTLFVSLLIIFVGEYGNHFKKEDVYKNISEKMIHRHPHVFKDNNYENWDWDKLKEEEKKYSSNKEILELIPKNSPSLLRADKINGKMKKYFKEDIDLNTSEKFIQNNIKNSDEESLAKCLYHMSNIISKNNLNSELILNKFINEKVSNL
ncbi:MAG: MazG nucleotide pyrophosphohydrolase domain-containing protein [Lachnospirales bacterium]